MAGRAYCPAVNPNGSIRFPQRITFCQQPDVSLCQGRPVYEREYIPPIPLKPGLDIITEPRRDSWRRGRALVLTLKGWAPIWRMYSGWTV
jgi:hypothetical protein